MRVQNNELKKQYESKVMNKGNAWIIFMNAGQVEICNYLEENSVRNYYLFLIVMVTQLVECLLEAQEVGSSNLSHHTRSI